MDIPSIVFRGTGAPPPADFREAKHPVKQAPVKNMTKVGWVSEKLTNGSLSLEVTTDIIVELARQIMGVRTLGPPRTLVPSSLAGGFG